ncbi:MAG: anti-sigma factor [Nitrospirota bacterium]
MNAAGEPVFGSRLVSLRGLPPLAATGAAFVYEAWLQDSQGGRISLGRFDVHITGQFVGSDPFAALASDPPQAGDQVRITVEPIDDPEPDAPYPFIPLSGRFQIPVP